MGFKRRFVGAALRFFMRYPERFKKSRHTPPCGNAPRSVAGTYTPKAGFAGTSPQLVEKDAMKFALTIRFQCGCP